jgi:metal transporter CNNM
MLKSPSQAELKSFLKFHRTGEEPLRDDEISILNGVLELNTKNVEQIMTPMKVCLFSGFKSIHGLLPLLFYTRGGVNFPC